MLYGTGGPPKASRSKGNKKLAMLMDELESHDEPTVPALLAQDVAKPWLSEFNQYLDAVDEVPNGMMITQWWGVSSVLFSLCYSAVIEFYRFTNLSILYGHL